MDATDDGGDTAPRGSCRLSAGYDNRTIKHNYRHYRRDYAYDNSRENGHLPNTQEYT